MVMANTLNQLVCAYLFVFKDRKEFERKTTVTFPKTGIQISRNMSLCICEDLA